MRKSTVRIFGISIILSLLISALAGLGVLASAAGEDALEVSDSAFSSIIMNLGADQTQRNLTWYSTQNGKGEVHYAKSSGDAFPEEYAVAEAFSAKTSKAGHYSYKATLVGLEADTTYVYRLAVGNTVSTPRTFKVNAFGDSFSFAFVADAQLGSSSEATKWTDTLQKLQNSFDEVSFIVSAGDQTSDPANEKHFDYFISEELSSIAISTTVGPPHDNSLRYSEHYYLPNLSSDYGVSNTSSDYFYKYNNVLFMHLNVENTKYAEHIQFMENVTEENPDCLWRIVVLHYSFFTGGDHSMDSAVRNFRSNLASEFTRLGVDAVLSGHDHMYVRSNMMTGANTLSGDLVTNNTVTDPLGTLYLCGTRPSGASNYTVEQNDDDAFIAYRTDIDRKAVSVFEVTETSLTLKSYFMDKSEPELFDTFTIIKSEPAVRLDSESEMLKIDSPEGYIPLVGAYDYTSATVKVINGSWAISTDGGSTFTSLDIPSEDTSRVLRINSSTGSWELSCDGGVSFTSLNIQTKTYTVRFVHDPNAAVNSPGALESYITRRYSAAVPDATAIQLSRGSLEEGNFYKWHWEYYTTDLQPVTEFTAGQEYLAFPVAVASPVRSNMSLAMSSDPANYTYTWAEAFEIVMRCTGEPVTLTLSENITLSKTDKVTLITQCDLTVDLNGKTLNASAIDPVITFGVGSNGSTLKVISGEKNGTLDAQGVDFARLSSNNGSVITVQYGSNDAEPITVKAGFLASCSSNFKSGSTLNLNLFAGTYTVSDGILNASNISSTAKDNIYKLSFKNAQINLDSAAATVVRFTSNTMEAATTSNISASDSTFTNTYKAKSDAVKPIFQYDNWLGGGGFYGCTFQNVAPDRTADGTYVGRSGTITVNSSCVFYYPAEFLRTHFSATFESSKLSLPAGTVLARYDEDGEFKAHQSALVALVSWYNPVGYSEYWQKGLTPVYSGADSFTVGMKKYTLVLAETPSPVSEDKVYTFVNEDGDPYRYNEERESWQISSDGGLTYDDLSDDGFVCKVTIGDEVTYYTEDCDFKHILESLNTSANENKTVTVLLGESMTLDSTLKFSAAKNCTLNIDLGGNTLTLASGGKLQFGCKMNLNIYSSKQGGALVYNSSNDCIQLDTGLSLTVGSESYKNYLTVTAPSYMINTASIADASVLNINFLYTTLNSGSYGILRLNAKGSGAVTLKANIVGCTVNASASVIYYNASSSLSASSNGGVYTVDSYISFTDTELLCTSSSVGVIFGHSNFTDRYFGKVKFKGTTFDGFEINGERIRSDEALDYNSYYSTLVGYDPDKAITVDTDCVFKNCGATFNSDKTAFTSSNVSLGEGTVIMISSDSTVYVLDTSLHDLVYRSENGVHYITCADCNIGARFDEGECVGGTPTCTSGAVCTVCGLAYGDTAPHEYKIPSFDGESHWIECLCGAKDPSTVKAHEYDDACDAICECTYERVAPHVPNDSFDSDGLHHWKSCEKCLLEISGTREEHTGEATCTAKATCEVCSAEFGDLVEHSYGEEMKYDETHHWLECTCSHREGSAEHAFDDWFREGNTRSRSCECGYTETETVKSPTQNDTAQEDTDKGVNVPLIICIVLGVSAIGVGAYLVFFKKKKD